MLITKNFPEKNITRDQHMSLRTICLSLSRLDLYSKKEKDQQKRKLEERDDVAFLIA